MTYNAKMQFFTSWYEKTKTHSDSTDQTTVENAWVYKKILFLDNNHVLVPPLVMALTALC